MKTKIIHSIIIFISFFSCQNVYSQYCVGVQAGYIRSGFLNGYKPNNEFNQRLGLRDGYGSSAFFEIVIDSTNCKIKIEVGYSKQNSFLDVEGWKGAGKGPMWINRYGRKVDYTFDFFNLSILYSQQLINRKSFGMNALFGLNFARNFKYEQKGFGWDYISSYAEDSLGNPYTDIDNKNWEANSTHFNRALRIAPTLGLEVSFGLNSKMDILFQGRACVSGSPINVERKYYYSFIGTNFNVGFRYRL